MDISGQRVLITGCTSGIGKACAFRFAELGCQLILIGRSEQRLQYLAQEIKQALDHIVGQPQGDGYPNPPSYPPPMLVHLDLRDVRMIRELPAKIGDIDILINNAGMNLGGQTCDKVQLDDAVSMVSCNLMAPMEMVSAFGALMKQRGHGHIVNIASTAARDVYQNASVYCATKAALDAYSQAVRHDFLETPIRCTSICPGLVNSELHIKKLGDPEKAAQVCEGIVPLDPEDIADQIVYACTRPVHVQVSTLASYCTNQSHSGMKGAPAIARMGSSLGAPAPDPYAPQQPSYAASMNTASHSLYTASPREMHQASPYYGQSSQWHVQEAPSRPLSPPASQAVMRM